MLSFAVMKKQTWMKSRVENSEDNKVGKENQQSKQLVKQMFEKHGENAFYSFKLH